MEVNMAKKLLVGLMITLAVCGVFSSTAWACHYVPGDINGDGRVNGLDIIFAVWVYRSGYQFPPERLCECPPGSGNFWLLEGDVNGSCTFNGLDVTYMVTYLKGGPALHYCALCPPE